MLELKVVGRHRFSQRRNHNSAAVAGCKYQLTDDAEGYTLMWPSSVEVPVRTKMLVQYQDLARRIDPVAKAVYRIRVPLLNNPNLP